MSKCRLDIEVHEGDWQSVKMFDSETLAQELAETLTKAGILAMVSCACGSYGVGECEGCDTN